MKSFDDIVNSWINADAVEKRDYQKAIVETTLKGNTLCVIPTGLGKTAIAAMVAAHKFQQVLDNRKIGKVLFLAPTKPLVNQHKMTFDRCFKAGLEFATVTGDVAPDKRRQIYQGKADVIFSTPQTIENDVKNYLLNMKEFVLLVIDEAHRCVGDYAYVFVAKKYLEQSNDPLILALTASPGSQKIKIDEIKRKLEIKNVEIRSRVDKDVMPYVQEVGQDHVEVALTPELSQLREFLEKTKAERMSKLQSWGLLNTRYISKTQIIRLQAELAKKKTGSSFAAISLLAELLKLDHALILLETQSLYSLDQYIGRLFEQKTTRATARLLADSNFKAAQELLSNLISLGAEHPKLEKLKQIVKLEVSKDHRMIIFTQYRDTVDKIVSVLGEVEGAKPVAFIGQTKKAGKGLSQKEQIQIIQEFKFGIYNILVATSIGEEGLDIEETDLVIFYEPVPSEIRSIQRMGRTGRTRSGKVLYLITKGTRDEAFYWSSHNKEKKMKKILYAIKEKQDTQSSLRSIG